MQVGFLVIPIYEKTEQDYRLNLKDTQPVKIMTMVNANLIARISPFMKEDGEINYNESHIQLTYGERLHSPLNVDELVQILNTPPQEYGVPLDKNRESQ